MDQITLKDVLTWVADNLLSICAILSIFIEIIPVKINPVSWVIKLLTKPIREELEKTRKELKDDINQVKSELGEEINQIRNQQLEEQVLIDKLIESSDLSEVSRIRWEIIEFSRSITNNLLHSRDEYLHIKDDCKKYHSLIEKYGLENGIIDDEYQRIEDHYEANKNSANLYY